MSARIGRAASRPCNRTVSSPRNSLARSRRARYTIPLMNALSLLLLARRHAGALISMTARRACVEELTAERLRATGAWAVILDHDGILGPNFSRRPDESGMALINRALEAFGPGKVFILSNTRRRRAARSAFYGAIPGVVYLIAERKPDTDGLRQAARLSGVSADRIAVVDDGPLTGGLMALTGGAIPVYAVRSCLNESPAAFVIRQLTTLPQRALIRILALGARR